VEWPQARAQRAESEKRTNSDNPTPGLAPARAVRVLDRADEERTEPFLELEGRAIYSIEFHPRYHENGYLFVCSKTHPEGGAGINILSRFVVSRRWKGRDNKSDGVKPACDPASEQRILEWPSEGHDGGAVVFGHDGMLYVSTGDGTVNSDIHLTAQDAGSMLGKILRIDVDHPAPGMPYSIPPDNPFLDLQGARGEIWSLGHRNPWRMSVDAKTGALWVGNNGQDLWEFAHLVERGDNCGWSVYEGSHPFYLHRQQGPGRLAPPTVEHDHGAFRSLTGGVVYYGNRFPEIEGAYVYGDYSTGAIWGVKHNGRQVVWNRELAKTTLDVVGFVTSHREDLLVLDHASGLYRLVESPPYESNRQFPRKLSETGVFDSVAEHRPAAGVVPFVVAAPGWMDGAVADRLLALPGDSRIERVSASQWEFPEGTVVVQTLSLPATDGSRDTPRRVETRILTKQTGVWSGYSYVWNDAQDDAVLVPPEGTAIQLPSDAATTPTDEQPVSRTWRVPSRTDCMACHSRAANFILGLSELQTDCTVQHDDVGMNQLHALEQSNVVDQIGKSTSPDRPRLVNPYDASHDLEARVRSYLHVNCSCCHVAAGGGNSRIQLNVELKRDEMQLVGAYPQHQTFGLTTAQIVAPKEPQRSILYHRISRRGPGQMPPRGTQLVDHKAVQLFHDWIAQLPPQRQFVRDWVMEDVASDLNELSRGRNSETGARLFKQLGCSQCHRFAGSSGGAGPDLSGIGGKRSPRDLLESILEPSKQIAPEFATTVIVTTDGQIHQGRVGQEDDSKLVLHVADALADPMTVFKQQIDERYLSSTSIMPEGLLDTVRKSEIFDLLAYLVADGKDQHPEVAE
jgi:uncharacterized repeat protein (TIGR03806 family)